MQIKCERIAPNFEIEQFFVNSFFQVWFSSKIVNRKLLTLVGGVFPIELSC